MVTVERILDSSARDKQLRAFAYLQARFSTGTQNAIDCLLPFILYAIAELENEQFDERAVIDYISTNYGISMPFYMIEEMRPRLRQLGALDNNNIADLDICRNISDRDDAKSRGLDIQLEDIAKIGDSLANFAIGKGVEAPFTCDSWEDAIIRFFQSESHEVSTSSTKVKDVIVLDAAPLDNKIVSDYILWCSQNDVSKYEIIQRIYYGVLVGDFLSNLWATGNKIAYKNLVVFYDATVLMRLLGTSGNQLRIATLELHETLAHLGCRIYYFEHTLDELLSNIEAVVQADKHGGRMHPETNAALGAGEITIGSLNLIKAEADFLLGQLGITQHEAAYARLRPEDKYQIDENAFTDILQSARRTLKGRVTWETDARSLALLVRLRRGKTSRDVSECGCIFVTSNRYLAAVARKFLIDGRMIGRRDVGPMLTVGQMTTVAWLADEIPFEANRISKELVANCYRASMPTAGWDEAFWEALNRGNPEEAKRRLDNAIFVDGARRIAMDESMGQAMLVPKLDMASILLRAEEQASQIASAATVKGEASGRKFTHTMIVRRSKERCRNIAEKIVNIIVWVTFIIGLVVLVLSVIPVDLININMGVFGRIVLGAISVASLMELLKIQSVHHWFAKLEDWLYLLLYKMLYRNTLEEDDV